jgi:hypothetical protein
MSGWDSRIQIRADDAAAWEGNSPPPTLNAGEMAAAIKGDTVEVRVGTSGSQAFASAPILMAGSQGFAPLVIDGGGTSSGAGLLWWDGTKWEPDATPIAWNTSTASGAVVYTDSTDTWSANAALTVITDADGGTFTGSFVAPSFSASYDPTIGEP